MFQLMDESARVHEAEDRSCLILLFSRRMNSMACIPHGPEGSCHWPVDAFFKVVRSPPSGPHPSSVVCHGTCALEDMHVFEMAKCSNPRALLRKVGMQDTFDYQRTLRTNSSSRAATQQRVLMPGKPSTRQSLSIQQQANMQLYTPMQRCLLTRCKTRTWPLLKRCSETKCVETPLSATLQPSSLQGFSSLIVVVVVAVVVVVVVVLMVVVVVLVVLMVVVIVEVVVVIVVVVVVLVLVVLVVVPVVVVVVVAVVVVVVAVVVVMVKGGFEGSFQEGSKGSVKGVGGGVVVVVVVVVVEVEIELRFEPGFQTWV